MTAPEPTSERGCFGTLPSRRQYLPDLAAGDRDAQLPPHRRMSTDAIAAWQERARDDGPDAGHPPDPTATLASAVAAGEPTATRPGASG